VKNIKILKLDFVGKVCLKELKVKTSLLGMIYGLSLNKKATKLKTIKTSLVVLSWPGSMIY